MGYLHIYNLYKDQDILLFKQCYAMEKIHGTSAHIKWEDGKVTFFSGGENHERFVKLFNEAALVQGFSRIELSFPIIIFGEAYGGKQQGMSATYGKELKFIAFDVKIGDLWLDVPKAEKVVKDLGLVTVAQKEKEQILEPLEFVHWVKIDTTLEAIDAERDADSVQAIRNGVGPGKKREGVVLRPLIELRKNNGDRLLCKHKRDDFCERATPQKIVDPSTLKVLEEANAIADEWVTVERMNHVMAHLIRDHAPIEGKLGLEHTKYVVNGMVEDIIREAAGEIVDSKEARKAIGHKTVVMFKKFFQDTLIKKDKGEE